MYIPLWVEGGRTLNMVDLQPEDLTPMSLASALAKMNRFSGRTDEPWSVAAHSVLVERLCPPDLGPWALLHDAHEAIIGDITTPAVEFIAAHAQLPDLAEDIARAKGSIDRMIAAAWGLPLRSANAVIRRADHIALLAETMTFQGNTPEFFNPRDTDDVDRATSIIMELQDACDWRAARDLWLLRAEHYAHLGKLTPPRAQHQPQTENE